MAQAKKQSEHMFVEWALDIQAENYDVTRVAELLNGLGNSGLEGLDVGGGIGRYAQLVCDKVPGCKIIVLDKSELADDSFVNDPRLELKSEDFFNFEPGRRYDFLIFKTVLHHFIGESEEQTRQLQRRALAKARQLLRPGGLLLIEENFYQGVFGDDLPGRLIFAITRQRWIENLVRRLGANTAGEGVRFRSFDSWKKVLNNEGFVLRSLVCSPTWGSQWPLWQRLPLISARRFQGVLEARVEQTDGDEQKSEVSLSDCSGLGAPSFTETFAIRVCGYWRRTSTWSRWVMALVALLTPLTLTTCVITEA